MTRSDVLTFLPYAILSPALLYGVYQDLKTYTVPHWLTLPMTLLGLLIGAMRGNGALLDAFLGVTVAAGVTFLVTVYLSVFTGKVLIGGGDVTLLAMVGAFLGYPRVLLVIVVTAALAVIGWKPLHHLSGHPDDGQLPLSPLVVVGVIFAVAWVP